MVPSTRRRNASVNPLTLTDGTFGEAGPAAPTVYPDAFLAEGAASGPLIWIRSTVQLVTTLVRSIRIPVGEITDATTRTMSSSFATVDNPTTFITLATVNYVPTAGSPSSARVNIVAGAISWQLALRRFASNSPQQRNGYVGYREIDVIGVPR